MGNFRTLLLFFAATFTVALSGNVCNYKYSVQKTGITCDVTGGFEPEVEEKVIELHGGSEAIKVYQETNVALIQGVSDTVNSANQNRAAANRQLDMIAKDIEALKNMLATIRHDEEEFQNNVEEFNPRSKRASSPVQEIQDAIHEAEMKVYNMTQYLADDARRHSMLQSSVERRILQQGSQLYNTKRRIVDLENRINQFGTQTQPSTSTSTQTMTPTDLAAFESLVNTSIEVRATVAAQEKIMEARLKDLDHKIDNVRVPVAQQNAQLKVIYSDTLKVETGTQTVKKALNDVEKELKVYEQKFTSTMFQVLAASAGLKGRYKNLVSGLQQVATTVMNSLVSGNNESQTISDIKVSIYLLAQQVTDTLRNLTRQHQDVHNLENSQLISFAESNTAADVELLKEIQTMRQLTVALNGIKKVIGRYISPTPIPTGHHPRSAAASPFKAIFCGM